jgi:Putative metal-binding motif
MLSCVLPIGISAAIVSVVPTARAADTPIDLDGWTVEDGDCDDDDSAVWPGAPELCATHDMDCDGVVTWDAGEWMPTSVAALEGTTVRLTVEPPCEGELRWTVPGLMYCVADGNDLECDAQDDYYGLLSATLLGADGEDLEVQSATFEVLNVAPIPGTGWLLAGDTVLVPGEDLKSHIWVTDPGADTLQYEIFDAPPGMAIDQDGFIRWQATRDELGDWDPTVKVTDDDDGHGSLTFHVAVARRVCGGCSGGGAALIWGLGGMAGLRRRERPRSRAELMAER